MRIAQLASAAAIAVALSAHCRTEDFSAAEERARIESLSSELDKVSAYYTSFWDTLNQQLESIDSSFETAYVKERDIDAVIDNTLQKMEERYARATKDYDAAFTDMQSYETQLGNLVVQLQKMLDSPGMRPASDEPWAVDVWGYWRIIQAQIPTLPNPFVSKQGSFWSSPCAYEFAYGTYSSACKHWLESGEIGCDCWLYHGDSNIDEVRRIMSELQSASLKVEELRQHPPTWR